MEWVIQVINMILTPLFGFGVGYLVNKVKKAKSRSTEVELQREAEHEAIKEVCKESLLESLKKDHDVYKAAGYCSVEDKEEVTRKYKLYHDNLKGNGRGTRYYNSIMELPDDKE